MDENDRDSIIDQTMCHKNRSTLTSNTINDMAIATQIMAMRPHSTIQLIGGPVWRDCCYFYRLERRIVLTTEVKIYNNTEDKMEITTKDIAVFSILLLPRNQRWTQQQQQNRHQSTHPSSSQQHHHHAKSRRLNPYGGVQMMWRIVQRRQVDTRHCRCCHQCNARVESTVTG